MVLDFVIIILVIIYGFASKNVCYNSTFLSSKEYSLDFKVTEDAEGCHKFCGKTDECNWWSWEPAFELCMLFVNCTDNGIDPPAVEPCPDCISGEKM